eukprot:CAMPEP_0196579154 /NCGR_PEP_ID=MMETSP1081-20130531/17822_1 /TAXON_ID=36882 /ORGANISM="Pyramimonas amylifera, Strain CCMP720" /LENGTH=211 /DNA_ID=CAMNT_0041898627 /DNA_START=269 /DNA_END=901 /DNA_ORIENTATION=+
MNVISISDLSDDLLSKVFLHLPSKLVAVCPVAGVCKIWRDILLEHKALLITLAMKINPLSPYLRSPSTPPPRSERLKVPPILLATASSGNLQGIVGMAELLSVHSPKPDAALKWWKAAAKCGHPQGQFKVGEAHYRGSETVPQDGEEAMVWLSRAAKNPECPPSTLSCAATILGYLHLDGEGTKIDNLAATKWFMIGKANGNLEAEKTLGW